jgi:ferredoxin
VGDWPAPGTETGVRPAPGVDSSPGPTPGRTLLQELLRDVSWSPSPSLRHDARLPWASLRIDQRDCATCGTCVNLCPTGAITRRIANDRLSHYFNGALCVNCGLCEEACPQHVIGFEPEFDARELVHDEAHAITDIRLHGCEICGEALPEREGRFCVTCHRRGRVENYVPGAAIRLSGSSAVTWNAESLHMALPGPGAQGAGTTS